MKEEKLLTRLRIHDRQALDLVCRNFGEDMLILAHSILQDPDDANILVHDLLLSLWEQGFPGATFPLHSFLYDQVRRQSLAAAVKIYD